MKITLLVSALIAVFSLEGCQTSPTGRSQLVLLPEDQVDAMGVKAFDEQKAATPIERDPATNTYVKCVANAITNAMGDGRQWEVVVFKDETANAFALPGGKIGVHTGILKVAQTPDQLAAVIGHEVGHVIANHGNERMTETLGAQTVLALLSGSAKQDQSNWKLALASLGVQYGLLLPHGRTQESEADVVGLDLMSRAGFDPRQSVELWKNMAASGGGQPPEFLSTHPSHETRMADLNSNMPKALVTYNATPTRPSCKR